MIALGSLKVVFLISLVAFLGFIVFVFIPPFENPSNFNGVTYRQLESDLGEPSIRMPGKYVAWKKGRFIGSWVLLAAYDYPPDPVAQPLFVERYFSFGFGDGSIKIFRDTAGG